jgi:chemotaxis protein CheX
MTKMTVKVEHINPFILSTMETFSKMVGIPAKPGKIQLKQESGLSYDISGIIGLSGGAKGMIALSFPKETAISVTNKFVGTDSKDLNDDIVDAMGELANIVAGNAKKGLSEFNIMISLPSVVMGEKHQVKEPKDVFSFIVPFTTDLGNFDLAVSLKSEI